MIPIRDVNRSASFPFLTVSLIFLNSFIWLYEWRLDEISLQIFLREFGLVPRDIFSNPKSLITHMFLHGNWFHIISNMWVLWIFGDNVEDVMGKIRFLIFYLLCGLGAAFLQILVSVVLGGAGMPMVGASGAISGVLAAYMRFFPGARIISLVPLLFIITFAEIPALVFVGMWFMSQIINGIITIPFAGVGGVAWWAHIGGFITGLYLSPHFLNLKRLRRRQRLKIF